VRQPTFDTISDAMDESKAGDVGWLDAALDVIASAQECGRLAVVHALVVLAKD
jgi:hypothetical protein